MTLSELKQDAKWLALADSTSTYYSDTDLVRSINKWYRIVMSWAEGESADWEVDDTSYSTLPIYTTSLTAGQSEYRLEDYMLDIERVEVKDVDGNWHLLKYIDKDEINVALDEFQENDGLPLYYDLMGDVLRLYPAPSSSKVDTSAGNQSLKVYVKRDIQELSADTDEPGFPRQFHRLLSLGAAYDFALANSMDNKALLLRREIDKLKQELMAFYGRRTEQSKLEPSTNQADYV